MKSITEIAKEALLESGCADSATPEVKVGDRIRVMDHLRCIESGHPGTITAVWEKADEPFKGRVLIKIKMDSDGHEFEGFADSYVGEVLQPDEQVDANDEAVNGGSAIQKKDNGDGTTTLSVHIALDPKVVEEKSKAIQKGMKREDIPDDLGGGDAGGGNADGNGDEDSPFDDRNWDDTDEDDDDEDIDPYNEPVQTQDEAIQDKQSLFVDALDEMTDVMDARNPERHNTPLENCRARDKRFCRYHGDKAFVKDIEDKLESVGITQRAVVCKRLDDGTYDLSAVVPNESIGKAEKILTDLLGEDGISDFKSWDEKSSLHSGQNQKTGFGSSSARFETDYKKDNAVDRINEWTDDLIEDAMNDTTGAVSMEDIEPLLEKSVALNEFDAKQNRNDPKYYDNIKPLVDDITKEYHRVKAQMDYADVQTPQDAEAIAKDAQDRQKKASDEYHNGLAEVDAIKTEMFKGFKGVRKPGNFPDNFGKGKFDKNTKALLVKGHHWAQRYSDGSYTAHKAGEAFKKSVAEYQAALQAVQQNPSDENAMKNLRTAISGMDYRADAYEDATAGWKMRAKQVKQDLYDWAQTDAQAAANIAAAFPQGRPN